MQGLDFYQKLVKESSHLDVHPRLGSFLRDYLSHEKVQAFGDQWVINTHLPPYPSDAFNKMLTHFQQIGRPNGQRRLFSVTLAVTNRCPYRCWHCYNAGRDQEDLSLEIWLQVIDQLLEMQVVHVTLSGGEPLLRHDLERIVSGCRDRAYMSLNTTGLGLTRERAQALQAAGLFALGISLDAANAAKHDALRGHEGAFDMALTALRYAEQVGLYPYVIITATHEMLREDGFEAYYDFVAKTAAREIHVLEPCATGKLAGHDEVRWTDAERQRVLDFQRFYAHQEDGPIVSTFAHIEGEQAFGCGAGLTHFYIDGKGHVCPCNLVPTSFGNVQEQSLSDILQGMSPCFQRPRTDCIGQVLNRHIDNSVLPLEPSVSKQLCEHYLPAKHEVPRFVEVQNALREQVIESHHLQTAYDEIHHDYEQYWLERAAAPVAELIDRVDWRGVKRVFEVGCGTGYATVQLARRADVTAVDLSAGMLSEARARLEHSQQTNVNFIQGDALEQLELAEPNDVIFSSWVLGYIPLQTFFAQAYENVIEGGRLAFLAHTQNSPTRELLLFRELIALHPEALQYEVAFDFPTGRRQVEELLTAVGFSVDQLWQGQVVFTYESPQEVLDHLLKSGAGTAYDQALDPSSRDDLHEQFLERRALMTEPDGRYQVIHDYLACIAVRD